MAWPPPPYPYLHNRDPGRQWRCHLCGILFTEVPIIIHTHTQAEWDNYQTTNALPAGYPHWDTGGTPPVPQGARDYRKQPLAKDEKAAPVEYNSSMFEPVTRTFQPVSPPKK